MFLHSWTSYFKITLCSLLPLIGTNKKKGKALHPAMHLSQTWVLHVQSPSASTGKLMSSVTDRPHSSSQVHRSPRLAKSWRNKSNLWVHWPPLLQACQPASSRNLWKSPNWKKLNQTGAASHVPCHSRGGWPRYSHSRHHFPCSCCSPALPSLNHNQCTSIPLQCLWIPFQALKDHRYLTSWKFTGTHLGANRDLSGFLS